jgi:hypothetical protein
MNDPKFKIGDKVRYAPTKSKNIVRYIWKLSDGQWLYGMKGHPMCYTEKHLEKIK